MGCSGSKSNKANEIAIVSKGEQKEQNETKSNCKNAEGQKDEKFGPETMIRDGNKPETPKIEKSSSLKQPSLESQISTWLDSIFISAKSHLIQKI